MPKTAQTPATTPQVDPAPAGPEPKSGDLPEWARKQISDANQEAANFRVQLRAEQQARQDLETRLATLTADSSTTTAAKAQVQSDFDRLVTAIKAEVPLEHLFTFANTLKGETEEQLTAHAADLKAMFGLSAAPSPAVDPSQGLGNGSPNTDPAHQFAAFVRSQLTR